MTTELEITSAPGAESANGCCGPSGVSPLSADEAVSLADRLGAVADPVRLQMLSIMAASPSGEVCACDFVGPIDKSQPTVSHHLKVLAEAGLIDGDKRGRWVWYRLAPSALQDVLGAVAAVAVDEPVAD
ncbi:MAG: metalloregulator ArsR/SmtB family transcription factor [Ilumatobacteraceae bacterium]